MGHFLAYTLRGDMGLPTHCLASSAAPHLMVGAAEQVACFPDTIYSLTQPPVRQSWLVYVWGHCLRGCVSLLQ